MKNIKQGDILQYKDGDGSRKVLGICGDVYFLSEYDDYNSCDAGYTLKEIEEDFILPKSKWKPKNGEEYYYIVGLGEVVNGKWLDYADDIKCRDFMGVFPDKKSAQKRLEEIKVLLKDN